MEKGSHTDFLLTMLPEGTESVLYLFTCQLRVAYHARVGFASSMNTRAELENAFLYRITLRDARREKKRVKDAVFRLLKFPKYMSVLRQDMFEAENLEFS